MTVQAPVAQAVIAAAPQQPAGPKKVHPLALQKGSGVIGVVKAAAPAVAKASPFASAKSVKGGYKPPVGNVCPVCDRSVFKMEEVQIEGKVFHKWCCRCSIDTCNKRLTAGGYASYQGKFYCKPCFMKCFKQAGNYDEGFGHKQHKLNWVSPEKGHSLEGSEEA